MSAVGRRDGAGAHRAPHGQRGGFVMGLVVGLLAGLALALVVALYITKAPIPFVNKVPQRTAEQDSAEAERNRNWDPNAPLAGKPVPRPAAPVLPPPVAAEVPAVAGAASAATRSASAAAARAARDPATILSGGGAASTGASTGSAPVVPQAAPPPPGPEAFMYFVQAGAFTRSEEAEQQRARLAMMGHSARISEREQAGRTVWRVRLGPFDTREEADAQQLRLQESAIEARLVRVEKP